MSFSHNMNAAVDIGLSSIKIEMDSLEGQSLSMPTAAPGSIRDGVTAKKEPEYYRHEEPSTSAAGGVEFGESFIKNEDFSDSESLTMSTGSEQSWKDIKQEPAEELPTHYGELEFAAVPGSSLDGVTVKNEPLYCLDDMTSTSAAPGSICDGVTAKKEPEYYWHEEPSTSAAGGVEFGESFIKKEDFSDGESLTMSTAAGDIDIGLSSIKIEMDSLEGQSLSMPTGSEQSWKHIKEEPAEELPTHYGELEHAAAPGSILDGVTVKNEPLYYLDDMPSTSGAGSEQVWKHIKQEPAVELPTYYGELEHKDKAIFICHHCQRSWKSFISLRRCVQECFPSTVPKFRLKMSPSTRVKTSGSYRSLRQEGNLSKECSPATVADENRFACCECSYITNNRYFLKLHKLSEHSSNRPHSCPYCEYSAVRAGTLKRHIQAKHLSDKPHSCPQCKYSSVRANLLKEHILAKHSSDKPYSCPYCKYRAVKSRNLKLHILGKHSNDKPHSCPHCEYSTVRANLLKEHILAKHSNERPHSCPYCEYSTVKSGNLKIHIVGKHSNDKPRSCPYCEYNAVQAGNIKSHILAKHSNDKPHCCPTCEYRTCLRGTLKRHILAKHSNDKPHSCLHCEYRTCHRDSLKRHILAKHSNDKPHSCPHCEYRTCLRGTLKRHILAKHSNDKPPLLPPL